ncbi:MAG: DUF6036 family nucleotidyltransferase [Victivallales bacterium]|jgi:hypothetical protein
MKRQQFDDILLKAAKESKSKLIIIGSQAFFAATRSDIIPEIVEISDEVDILPENISDVESIECRLGEKSEYFERYGIFVHALEDIDRHMLTEGWRERLVPYKVKDSSQGVEYEVLCLSLPDICINKLCFGRPKDYDFVSDVVSKAHIKMREIESLAGSVQSKYRNILKQNIEKAKGFIRQNIKK